MIVRYLVLNSIIYEFANFISSLVIITISTTTTTTKLIRINVDAPLCCRVSGESWEGSVTLSRCTVVVERKPIVMSV